MTSEKPQGLRCPVAIDLFAGAGGFSLGFQMAGFHVPFALERDAWACDTLRLNNSNKLVIQADIRDFNLLTTVRDVVPAALDIIIGGPPCQGFSIAGPSQKDPKDPRNSLFRNFAQWISFLRPKVFVMENVKGILSARSSEGDKVIEIIKQGFVEMGYHIEVWLLNAAHYGVPQTRERVFVVGHLGEVDIGPPPITHLLATAYNAEQKLSLFDDLTALPSAPTVWCAISDLPLLAAGEGEEEQPYNSEPITDFQIWARTNGGRVFNHMAMQHSKRLVERFKHIAWGGSSSQVPEEHGARKRSGNGELSGTKYDQNNRRLHPYKPSHTIAASFYANFVHPFQHRNLTVREGGRLQSFPDTYRFMGKKTVVSHSLLQREGRTDEKFLCQYNQVGNAVPPLLAQAIARHIKDRLLC